MAYYNSSDIEKEELWEAIASQLPAESLARCVKELFRISDSAIITQHAKSALNFYVGNPICNESIAYSIKVLINAMRMPVDKTTLDWCGKKIPMPEFLKELLDELPIPPGNYLFSPQGIRYRGNLSKNVEGNPPILEPIKKNPKIVLDTNTNARLRELMNDKYYQNWYNRIWEMLDSSDEKIVQKVINYLGFLYLNLMRLMKTDGSLQYHITKNVSVNFKKLYGISDFSGITPPPHPEFYIKFGMDFRKTGANCCDVMVYLIEAYPEAKEILDEACLKELKFTGLGAIKWFYEATSHLKKKRSSFLKTLKEASSVVLKPCEQWDFYHTIQRIESYESKEDTSRSFPYCRLFEDAALCNLAVKSNKLFVAIMVHLIYSGGDLSIFKIAQLKCISENDKRRASVIAATIVSIMD